MTIPPTILACFAHPDDEVFGTGGAFARYAEDGAKVYLVCTTNGDVGQISDPSLATPETISQVRQAELRCSARTLGIQEPILLNYRDSGMQGDPENEDPRAYINAPDGDVVGRLVGIMRKLQPQVVITFDPRGGYGHPDHMAICRHTTAAFHAAADPNQYPEAGPVWQAQRLFYRVMARSAHEERRQQMTAAGRDPAFLDRWEREGQVWEDETVTVWMEVSPWARLKLQAIYCHATQFGADHPWRQGGEEEALKMLSRETFLLAWPQPEPGLRLADLLS